MEHLSALESAVLSAIADQVLEHGPALREQISSASVLGRENSGAGFYTTLAVSSGRRMAGAASPLGDVGADIEGLALGMGFLLWLRDGLAETLEGYAYGESTKNLDLVGLRYPKVYPRKPADYPLRS